MAKINVINFTCLVFLLGSCSYCSQYIAPLDFKGVVVSKYIGSYKHTPVIIVNANGDEIKFGPDGGDTLALYRHIQIGDSLIKRKGSYEFKVIRNGESKSYTMNCNPQ